MRHDTNLQQGPCSQMLQEVCYLWQDGLWRCLQCPTIWSSESGSQRQAVLVSPECAYILRVLEQIRISWTHYLHASSSWCPADALMLV